MRNLIVTTLLLAATVGILLVRCGSLDMVAGGSSSETVIGRVADEAGVPACSVLVTLYPETYDPVADKPLPQASSAMTDSSGTYLLKAPDSSARYSVVAIALNSERRSLMTAVVITGDTTMVEDARLHLPGGILITPPEGADPVSGYLYIPGTGVASFISGAAGQVLLDRVPAGTIPSVNYASRSTDDASVVRSAVEVVSGDTVVLPFPQWRYSRKLFLNTTASGAAVSGNVGGFPVLVRLNSANFPFSQARPDGADLRFSNPNGTRLAFEIERWDATAAEVWVRVDTVLGNNDRQYIVMHWGASISDVASLSNSTSVFDASRGFQGVWHLGGAGNGTVYDATVNQYHGTPYNMTAASAVAGAVGLARDFNGTTAYIAMPNTASGKLDLPENGSYAISLWAYADTIDTLWHAIAGKGHEQYYLKLKCNGRGRATWEFVTFQDRQGWGYTEDSVPPAPGQKQWVYLTGVRSGTKQYLYINGDMVNDSVPVQPGNYSRNTGDDFSIGRYARQVLIPYYEGWCYFNGRIDEVRVMSFAPGPDWIKLCYMNQRVDDKLVEFR
ncbi:MAG: DUF2341 domain-containing protein [Chitinispirillaceae bacterium]|nr:DUF2341 domain-containing protein [Chitinispirillaceae bacterium]